MADYATPGYLEALDARIKVLILIMIVPVIVVAVALERYISRGPLVGAVKG